MLPLSGGVRSYKDMGNPCSKPYGLWGQGGVLGRSVQQSSGSEGTQRKLIGNFFLEVQAINVRSGYTYIVPSRLL